jgi:hypothetical protein
VELVDQNLVVEQAELAFHPHQQLVVGSVYQRTEYHRSQHQAYPPVREQQELPLEELVGYPLVIEMDYRAVG